MVDKVVNINTGRTRGERRRVSGDESAAAITQFEQPFSIVAELSINREAYIGGEPFTVSGLPNYVAYSIERVKEDVAGKVHTSPVISCCIFSALGMVIERDVISDLIGFKRKLNKVRGVRADLAVMIHSILKTIPLAIPTDMLGATKPRIRIPEETRTKLNDTALDLGMPSSTLAVMCVLEALENQQSVLPDHRKLMTKGIAGFYERIDLQNAVAEALLGVLSRQRGK